MKEKVLMQGNEACAEGALYAGCRFFAGYPITPSTEIAEYLSEQLPRLGGMFLQMEDEIASIGAVIGASLAGLKAMTATSGPGFSLKQENIGFACIAEIPCVIIDVMRGGPSTGLPTGPSQSDIMQARWGTHGDHPAICLTPASVKEIFHETVRAFNLSEKYRTPVIVLTDEIISHMREPIVLPEPGEVEVIDRAKPDCSPEEYYPYDSSKGDIPPLAPFGEGYRFHVTGLNHDKRGFPTTEPDLIEQEEKRMLRKITNNLEDILKFEAYQLEDAEIIIVAFGVCSRSARFAIHQAREKGIPVGMLRPVTLWPFPEDVLKKVSRQLKRVIVPEMNLGQLIYEVERCTGGDVEVKGINRVDSEPITPQQILELIEL